MGIKVWFPNLYMRLISVNTKKIPHIATLHVPPKMTKTEVSEYLTKIYNVKVTKVNTMNYLGRWKRLYGKRKIIAAKRRNYKKAIVQFDHSE